MAQSNVFMEKRTLGDGIDNSSLKWRDETHRKQITFTPIEPNSKIFNLKPIYVSKERKHPKYLTQKPKEPKFVPYEPYKGAVEPIFSHKQSKHLRITKSSKNNVEIQCLVTQLSEMRTSELTAVKKDEPSMSVKQWEKEKASYENDIKNLRETNAHLENQVKFQSQVNSELKTLLVAAVGEDLESRVQHLTEDKLQLARALLNSANHLTSHQEQTEWLSGQCEVWRSKFLASSLMVEELARWKSALTNRINDLQEVIRKLIDERYCVQKKSLKTFCNLNGAISQLTLTDELNLNQKNINVIDLCKFNSNLSETLCDLMNIDKENCEDFLKCVNLERHTVAESLAIKLLQNPVTISNKQDAICNALMGTALTLSGEQVYMKSPNQTTCCSHCTGDIKNI